MVFRGSIDHSHDTVVRVPDPPPEMPPSEPDSAYQVVQADREEQTAETRRLIQRDTDKEINEVTRQIQEATKIEILNPRHTGPRPLPNKSLEVPQLSEEFLPGVWRPWLSDVAERLQCPPDYAAISAIVAAATLIGNRIRIRPKLHDPWLVVPNLWGAIVGPPGAMKTPAVREGLLFFHEIADRERTDFERVHTDAEFDKQMNEVKKADLIKEIRKASDERKGALRLQYENLRNEDPIEKRLWTTDVTVEKLGELLNENPDGLLVLRDELTGWLKSLDRPGQEQARAFYLEAWNGQGSFTFDRIGRGKTHVRNMTVSLLGTIQPSMIEPYYRSAMMGLGDDGLIQRFQMLVYPEAVKKYDYVDRPPAGRDAARDSFRLLYEFQSRDIGSEYLDAKAFLQFDDAAQDLFQVWFTDLEKELRSGSIENSALESHMAKYRGLMPSLALIFHLLARVTGSSSVSSISTNSVLLAIAWCDYLQKHATKLYTFVSTSEFDCARAILHRIQSGEIGNEFTARDIYGNHWKNLSSPNEVKQGLEVLTEYRYLTPTRYETGGRSKILYTSHESIRPK